MSAKPSSNGSPAGPIGPTGKDGPDRQDVQGGERDPADAWHSCDCGDKHWGSRGAAGTLIIRDRDVLLQLRPPGLHHGGSWGLPGGARKTGEAPLGAALRECQEETGLDPGFLEPVWWWVASHGGWSYTTFGAQLREGADPAGVSRAGTPPGAAGNPNWETAALEWVPADQVADRDLHPGFAAAWPDLKRVLGQRMGLIVDTANVMGSRPDGWWKDRAGAAVRLRNQLEPVASSGLANVLPDGPSGWFPEVVMVVEGRARGIDQGESVTVVHAPGEGDDQIVKEARRALEKGRSPVMVVTADKGLIGRLGRAGTDIMRPGRLLALIG